MKSSIAIALFFFALSAICFGTSIAEAHRDRMLSVGLFLFLFTICLYAAVSSGIAALNAGRTERANHYRAATPTCTDCGGDCEPGSKLCGECMTVLQHSGDEAA